MAKKKKKNRNQQAQRHSQPEQPESDGGLDLGDSGLAIEQTVAEDPLLKFFQERWREITITLLVVFGFFYGRDVFEQTRMESLRSSADLLLDLQAQVEELQVLSASGKGPNADLEEAASEEESSSENAEQEGESLELAKGDEKVGEDASAKEPTEWEIGVERANELARALAEERSPYSDLSVVYRRVIATLKDDANSSLVDEPGYELPSDRFEGVLNELGVFQRALLLSQEEGKLAESISLLESLVAKGNFTGSASLTLLVELSEANAGIGAVKSEGELKALSATYIERNPDQAALLKKELPQLF